MRFSSDCREGHYYKYKFEDKAASVTGKFRSSANMCIEQEIVSQKSVYKNQILQSNDPMASV